MEQRKFQRLSDSSLVTFSGETLTFPTQASAIEIELAPVCWVKDGSYGVEFIRIAPGSLHRLKQYLAMLEGASSDAA